MYESQRGYQLSRYRPRPPYRQAIIEYRAHLESDALEPRRLRGGDVDGAPARDAAGEGNKVNEGVRDGVRGERGAEVHDLEDGGGDACGVEGAREALGGEGRLRGGLEHGGVAGDERGQDGVDHDEVGVAAGESFFS